MSLCDGSFTLASNTNVNASPTKVSQPAPAGGSF